MNTTTTDVDTRNIFEKYPDVMADLESTGTHKARNAIIQIAAVRFNLAEGTICTEFFDEALWIPDDRFWMESTRGWWLKDKKDILNSIIARGKEPGSVLQAFAEWAGPGAVFWGKPTHFDFAFLESYYASFSKPMPFHYRMANDMNSFIRGRYFPAPAPKWEYELEFSGDKHNALHDCIHQIRVLFEVMKDTKVASTRLSNPDVVVSDAPF